MRTCRTLPKYTVSRAHVICSGPGIWRQYRPTFKLGGKVDCQIVKLFSWPQASNSSSLVPFSGSATATVIYKVYKRKALENTMTVVSFESESTMLTAPVLCTCMSSADNSHGLNWSLQNFRASSRRDYVHQIHVNLCTEKYYCVQLPFGCQYSMFILRMQVPETNSRLAR